MSANLQVNTGAFAAYLPTTTFSAMRRSVLSRFTALLAATLMGVSAPGVAVAHGHAHHESREQDEHRHEHEHIAAATTASHDAASTVQADGSDGDHDHPMLVLGPSVRGDMALFVVPAVAALPALVLVEPKATRQLIDAPPRAGPLDARPRQPRAPPLA